MKTNIHLNKKHENVERNLIVLKDSKYTIYRNKAHENKEERNHFILLFLFDFLDLLTILLTS